MGFRDEAKRMDEARSLVKVERDWPKAIARIETIKTDLQALKALAVSRGNQEDVDEVQAVIDALVAGIQAL
jgi:hypothetical protein